MLARLAGSLSRSSGWPLRLAAARGMHQDELAAARSWEAERFRETVKAAFTADSAAASAILSQELPLCARATLVTTLTGQTAQPGKAASKEYADLLFEVQAGRGVERRGRRRARSHD